MSAHPSILLIDDSPGESELFRQALMQTDTRLYLHAEPDIDRGLKFLTDASQGGTLPSVVLIDLKLRNEHGLDFLKRLRASHDFCHIPVIVFTTSDAPADLAASYAAGANGYVVKPGFFDHLVRFADDLARYWVRWNRGPYGSETRC
jgi:CheY-like chemotaxis protein